MRFLEGKGNMNNKVFGYCRVSSKEQNLERQIKAIEGYCKANNIEIDERDMYLDKTSGKDMEREEYKALKRTVRTGDIVIIKELDRLGRNKELVKEELKWFKDNGITLRILDIPTTLMNFESYDSGMAKAMMEMINNVLIEVLGTIAEEERNKIKQRQKEGIQALKEKNNGKGIGRPKTEYPTTWEEVYKSWKVGDITATKAMEMLGLKRNTFYRLVKEYEEAK